MTGIWTCDLLIAHLTPYPGSASRVTPATSFWPTCRWSPTRSTLRHVKATLQSVGESAGPVCMLASSAVSDRSLANFTSTNDSTTSCSRSQKHPIRFLILRSRSHCLSLALCLQWYNGSITSRVRSSVTKRTTVSAYTTDRGNGMWACWMNISDRFSDTCFKFNSVGVKACIAKIIVLNHCLECITSLIPLQTVLIALTYRLFINV